MVSFHFRGTRGMTSNAPFLHTDRDPAALAFGADPSDVDPSPLTTILTRALTPVEHMHATPTPGGDTSRTTHRPDAYCWVLLGPAASASPSPPPSLSPSPSSHGLCFRYTCLLAYALYTRALGAGALTHHPELTRMQYQYRPSPMRKTSSPAFPNA
jgi:hypothetical protein